MENRIFQIRMYSKDDGFTLMELLIAVAIFAVAATTLFSSLSAFIRTSGAVNDNIAVSETVQAVFRRVGLDFEAVVVSQYPAYKKPEFDASPDPYRLIGEKRLVVGQQVPYLSFVSLARTDFGPGRIPGARRVAYYIKENQSGLMDLYRSDTLVSASEDNEPCRDPMLCRDISKFEIAYIDSDGEENFFWDSDSERFDYSFPAKVRFFMTLHTGESAETITRTIALGTGRQPHE